MPENSMFFMSVLMTKPGPGSKFEIEYNGRKYNSGRRWWGTTKEGFERVIKNNRVYDYYELAHPNEGVGSGFKYKTVPHITLKSIANNEVSLPFEVGNNRRRIAVKIVDDRGIESLKIIEVE